MEAGWEIRVKYHWEFAEGLDDAGALALFTIKFNSVGNGDPANGEILSHEDIEISHHWDYPHENHFVQDAECVQRSPRLAA